METETRYQRVAREQRERRLARESRTRKEEESRLRRYRWKQNARSHNPANKRRSEETYEDRLDDLGESPDF